MPTDDVSITVYAREQSSEVVVAGDVTAFTCQRLVEAVITAAQEGARTIDVDLTEVSFIDSSGIQCLIQARKQAADVYAAVAKVTGMSERVRRVLEVTGLVEGLSGDEPL